MVEYEQSVVRIQHHVFERAEYWVSSCSLVVQLELRFLAEVRLAMAHLHDASEEQDTDLNDGPPFRIALHCFGRLMKLNLPHLRMGQGQGYDYGSTSRAYAQLTSRSVRFHFVPLGSVRFGLVRLGGIIRRVV